MKKYTTILFIFIFIATIGLGVKAYAEQKLSPTVISCMQDAVEKRDTAIITGMTTFSTSMTDILTKRKDSIKTSWTLETKEIRDTARKVAWDNYQKEAVLAKTIFKTSRVKVWEQFRTDRKACGVGVTDTGSADANTL